LQFGSEIKLNWMPLSQTELLRLNTACDHHICTYCHSRSTCLQVHLMYLYLYLKYFLSTVLSTCTLLPLESTYGITASSFCLFVNLILVPVFPSDSPILSPVTSSSSDLPLCISLTPSLFHSLLKTYLFHKST